MSNEATKKLIADLESAVERLERAAATATPDRLRGSLGPGKWTAHELISHIADGAQALYWRFLTAVAEPGAPVLPFDQDKWVPALREGERPLALSLAMIRACHNGFAYYLQALGEEELARTAVHPERGPRTAREWAAYAANHALHHTQQVERILAGP